MLLTPAYMTVAGFVLLMAVKNLSRRICNPTTEWSIRICDPAKKKYKSL